MVKESGQEKWKGKAAWAALPLLRFFTRTLYKSRRHARMILSGIHDFNDSEAGFPTRTASGMTFRERIFFAWPKEFTRRKGGSRYEGA
jgi:hypothetical protein